MHRTDRLSAAVNNLGDRDLFQERYRAFLAHYGLKAQAINARKAHENGDAEQSHNRFKTAVDQALMLRGGRDFEDRADYERFLRELQAQRNSGRTERFGEDLSALGGLPAARGRVAAMASASHPGQHDPHRLQHLLGAQPTDR